MALAQWVPSRPGGMWKASGGGVRGGEEKQKYIGETSKRVEMGLGYAQTHSSTVAAPSAEA